MTHRSAMGVAAVLITFTIVVPYVPPRVMKVRKRRPPQVRHACKQTFSVRFSLRAWRACVQQAQGTRLLHVVSTFGLDKIVRFLLQKGASKEATTADGKTALYLAAENGHVEVVKALLAAGANKHVKVRPTADVWTAVQL